MDINHLEFKWNLLNPEGVTGFKSLRISGDCIPDLFIGIDSKGGRCFILKLPAKHTVDFQAISKQNLSIELYRETGWIIIKLLNTSFVDLFNDLILSIYTKINKIDRVDLYTDELIHIFYKWSEFFDDNDSGRLSAQEIQGLFGEAFILRELLNKTNSAGTNDILRAWRGPFETGHDFILLDTNLEVKTKEKTNIDIKISSEYQLQPEIGKELQLIVLNVIKDPAGTSLHDLLIAIKDLVISRYGDLTILLDAVRQKGLTLRSLTEYNNLRFTPESIVFYNCMDQLFPKLIRNELPDLLNKVSYNIRIGSLEKFIISKTQF